MSLKSPLHVCLLVTAFAALGGMAATSTVQADDSLSCKQRIISIGDSMYEVRSLCGDPDFVQQRRVRRSARGSIRNQCLPGARCNNGWEDSIEMTIDEWTYDFGPNRFVQFLIFEDGKLVQVRNGEYGHKRQ
jgi:hypothetical protein